MRELPAGRLVGLGSSAAPGRFDSVTVVGIPDYKAVTAALEKALARAKVEMEASKLPWRNLVDAQAVASWQIRSGQWDVKAGQIEKSGPPRRGPGGRRGGGMNVGGPSLVTSGVKASAFVFEASVWVAARGEGSHRVALVFGSGGDEYSVFQDITANRYYVESSGGKGTAEHIPTADRLETGEEHHMRLTVIGTYVRLDVDGRTKLVAALAKPTKGELGLYAESGNEVRFRDIRARIITE